jgi:hypothetical protein
MPGCPPALVPAQLTIPAPGGLKRKGRVRSPSEKDGMRSVVCRGPRAMRVFQRRGGKVPLHSAILSYAEARERRAL